MKGINLLQIGKRPSFTEPTIVLRHAERRAARIKLVMDRVRGAKPARYARGRRPSRNQAIRAVLVGRVQGGFDRVVAGLDGAVPLVVLPVTWPKMR